MEVLRSPAIEAYWTAFRRACDIPEQAYSVCRMGDSAALADELLSLILDGPKRATAYLLRDVECGQEEMSQVGGHAVVVDGRGEPRAIWRTLEVTVKPLIEVDEAFAWDEGEGLRTRDDWLRLHRRYFQRRAAAEGFAFDDSLPTVFERFTLVWPAEVAS